jgi:ADP-heptose:LPS heptosyltransferase
MTVTKARTILVIRPDEIGDVILTSPFLRELRRTAPQAEIILLVKPSCFELVEYCPYVNAVYSLDFASALPWAVWHLRLSRLHWRGFDLVLLPRWDRDWYNSELVAHLLAGRGAVVAHRDQLVTRKWAKPAEPPFMLETYSSPKIEHEAESSLRFLRWCGGACAQDCQLEIWITEADQSSARNWLRQHLTTGNPFIVIHPSGGRSPLKQWPVAKYWQLLEQLATVGSWDFLIIGGNDETWIATEFRAQKSARVALAVGCFTLRQLAAVMKQAQLFVGGDSGPMHLAAAAGTPVIAIFGPTSELRFRPWGSHCRVISQRYPCSPDVLGTFEDRCATCRFSEPRCLTELTVEPVVAAVHAALSTPREAERGA